MSTTTNPLFYMADNKADGKIMTCNGEFFDILNPTPEAIKIEVIAHALAKSDRATGHFNRSWSVAEHSILVSRLAYVNAVKEQWSEEKALVIALAGLLHDASEAYVTDVPRPLKYLPGFEKYLEIEGLVQDCVEAKYTVGHGMDYDLLNDIVKAADNEVLKYEFRYWMASPEKMPWCMDPDEDAVESADYLGKSSILDSSCDEFWSWEGARDAFMSEYDDLKARLELRGVSLPDD